MMSKIELPEEMKDNTFKQRERVDEQEHTKYMIFRQTILLDIEESRLATIIMKDQVQDIFKSQKKKIQIEASRKSNR